MHALDPSDRALRGLCLFKIGKSTDAVKEFRNLRPEVIQNASSFGTVAVAAAGQARLRIQPTLPSTLSSDPVERASKRRCARCVAWTSLNPLEQPCLVAWVCRRTND